MQTPQIDAKLNLATIVAKLSSWSEKMSRYKIGAKNNFCTTFGDFRFFLHRFQMILRKNNCPKQNRRKRNEKIFRPRLRLRPQAPHALVLNPLTPTGYWVSLVSISKFSSQKSLSPRNLNLKFG